MSDAPQQQGKVYYKIRHGVYTEFVRKTLAEKGCRLLKINWNREIIHFLNKGGRKESMGFYGLPPKR